ncbi:MAG: hypothetical protein ISS49_03795 [Anaerolineae bacterium]|nr:hypothetical protein [Anaerolineae bacterium]
MLQHRVILEKHFIEPGDIPALALYKNDGKKKPLIITIHGYTGNKSGEIDYCLILAEQKPRRDCGSCKPVAPWFSSPGSQWAG